MSKTDFHSAFTRAIEDGLKSWHADNLDPYRYPERKPSASAHRQNIVREKLLRVAGTLNLGYMPSGGMQPVMKELSLILCQADGIAELYDELKDEDSRRVLIEVLAYRVLGQRHVKLSRNNPSYWESIRRVETECLRRARTIPIRILGGWLDEYEVTDNGYPIRAHVVMQSILNTFFLRQYEYKKGQVEISARDGDVVIDGGGCWGETALYFANAVGANGRVLSFEFTPENLSIFERNLMENRELATRIDLLREALWDSPGEVLTFHQAGPGTRVSQTPAEEASDSVATRTVDDLLATGLIDRVDFIKLDVEGSEHNVLRGAEMAIRQFKPRLAVSVYHRPDDFVTIPSYIRSLGLGYRFYLDHFTIHREETVLFAAAETVG